jgi:quinol-cytochrome oxidoreductase complex cytochrome b subunit
VKISSSNLLSRIYHSVFPSLRGSNQEATRRWFNTLLLHFRPRRIPEETLRFTLSWGLGGTAVVLILLLFGTGPLLKFVYLPFPEKAYESILRIDNDILFGQLVRNVHHWSGHLLLIVVFLHFLRVFFTGAFHHPRQFNWVIGLGLFVLVLCANFTGYLLPWDQLAYWAITISTGMLEYIPGIGAWLQQLVQGGREVGPVTLANFYALHTALLPAAFIILMSFHFWRVRKAGGLVIPRQAREGGSRDEVPLSAGRNPGTNKDEKVPAIPHLLVREATVALLLIAGILVFSTFFDAPLQSKANPGLSPNPTKAPWFFVGIQELLMHFHPLCAVLVIPLVAVIALLSLPYLNYQEDTAGVWFVSSRGRRLAIVAAAVGVLMTVLVILADEYLVETAWIPGLPLSVSNGVVPLGIVFTVVSGYYLLLRRKYAATVSETVQTVFVFLVTAFIVLTITGIWFRGTWMYLAWP